MKRVFVNDRRVLTKIRERLYKEKHSESTIRNNNSFSEAALNFKASA